MRFKIISVLGNSVRVNSGIVTFHVEVINDNGKLKIKIPDNIYIANNFDMNNLTGAVLGEYNHSIGDKYSRNEESTTVI